MRFSRPISGCLFASFVAILLALPLIAQAQQEEEYVLGTYEVGDLTMNIIDHPYGKAASQTRRGFQGGGRGGQFSVPEVASHQPLYLAQFGRRADAGMQHSMDDLIGAIFATVEPDSWTTNGGGGELRAFGTALVVWQTEPVHQKIRQLLTTLRNGNRPTLKVDARWLLLNSDDLAQLAPADNNGTTRVDPQVLDQFTRRPTSIRGLTQCFSGQLVYVVSGTQRNVVSGYIPVVGGGDVGYQPIVQKVNFGTLLEIRPMLTPGGLTAVVDLTATLTFRGEQPNLPGNFAPLAVPPAIDRIAIETQQLATTLRLPTAVPVIVGGLTYKPASALMEQPAMEQAAQSESPQLYLILQVQ